MYCKEATELISRKHEEKIGMKKNIALYQHLAICPYCRAFRKNSQELSKLMKKFTEKAND